MVYILEEMLKRKWHLDYDPDRSLRARYLVRLPGPGMDKVDGKPFSKTCDVFCFGQTIEEVFKQVLIAFGRAEEARRVASTNWKDR